MSAALGRQSSSPITTACWVRPCVAGWPRTTPSHGAGTCGAFAMYGEYVVRMENVLDLLRRDAESRPAAGLLRRDSHPADRRGAPADPGPTASSVCSRRAAWRMRSPPAGLPPCRSACAQRPDAAPPSRLAPDCLRRSGAWSGRPWKRPAAQDRAKGDTSHNHNRTELPAFWGGSINVVQPNSPSPSVHSGISPGNSSNCRSQASGSRMMVSTRRRRMP